MHIRFAEVRDATSIADIYNQGIEERSSTFETTLRRPNDMLERIALMERYPTLVMVNDANEVVAWAGLSSYRSRTCYDGIADFSIYLDRGIRGQGLGKFCFKRYWMRPKPEVFGRCCRASLPLMRPVWRCVVRVGFGRWVCTKNMHALKVGGLIV